MGLHPVHVGRDQLVGCFDDVARRAVVLHEVMDLRVVILLKFPDEPHVRAAERVDVLVIIAHGQDRQPQVGVVERPARNRADHVVLRRVDILVFVHQNKLEPGEKSISHLIRLEPSRALLALEQLGRVLDQRIEVDFVRCLPRVGIAQQAHREPVVGGDRHATRIVPNELGQPPAQFDCRVPVKTAHQDALRTNPLHPQ